MATPGELISIAAEALRMQEVTVGSYYRALREADLMTKGGRGRSAPNVTTRDIARLLIAILSSEYVRDAAAAAKVFGKLRAAERSPEYKRPRLGLDPDHSFEDAVCAVLQIHGEQHRRTIDPDTGWPVGPWSSDFEIMVGIDRRFAEISRFNQLVKYESRNTDSGKERRVLGLHTLRSVSGPALSLLSTAITFPMKRESEE